MECCTHPLIDGSDGRYDNPPVGGLDGRKEGYGGRPGVERNESFSSAGGCKVAIGVAEPSIYTSAISSSKYVTNAETDALASRCLAFIIDIDSTRLYSARLDDLGIPR